MSGINQYLNPILKKMSTRVYESRVLSAPVETVWAKIRSLDFKWLDTVKTVEITGGAGEVG